MGIITGYADDTTTSDSDKFLTVDSGGSTRLTPASNIKTYLGVAAGTTGLTDAGTTTAVIRSELGYDFIASGCVWTADSAGSTRNASMTAGVAYIGGKRVAISAITAHTFTASKDTYVDFDNTGSPIYGEQTNNGASPTLSASRIRNAIIVTGASSIAAAASINQGQEDRVLPIASSVPYAVTDSLGNLICPRDPDRKLLGFRQRIVDFLPGTTVDTLITGLNCPVIVPAGRKVAVSFYSVSVGSTGIVILRTYEGVFGAGGTQINQLNIKSDNFGAYLTRTYTPSTSSITYTAVVGSTSGNPTVGGAPVNPCALKVELV